MNLLSWCEIGTLTKEIIMRKFAFGLAVLAVSLAAGCENSQTGFLLTKPAPKNAKKIEKISGKKIDRMNYRQLRRFVQKSVDCKNKIRKQRALRACMMGEKKFTRNPQRVFFLSAAIDLATDLERYKMVTRLTPRLRKYATAALEKAEKESQQMIFDQVITLSYYKQAVALANLGNLEEALASTTIAVNKGYRNHFGYELRGDLQYKLRNYEQASENYQLAIAAAYPAKRNPTWDAKKSAVPGKIPDTACRLIYKRASAEFYDGNARACTGQIKEIFRRSAPKKWNVKAYILISQARLLEHYNTESALYNAREAVKLAPNNPAGYAQYAYVSLCKGYDYNAIEYANVALMMDSTNIKARAVRAQAYFNKAQMNEPRAMSIRNGKLSNWQKRSIAQYKKYVKQYKADCKVLMNLNPKFQRDYFYRGMAYYIMGKTPQALDDFNTIIEMNPKNVLGYWGRYCVFRNSYSGAASKKRVKALAKCAEITGKGTKQIEKRMPLKPIKSENTPDQPEEKADTTETVEAWEF